MARESGGSYYLAGTVFISSLLGLAQALALPFALPSAEYAYFAVNVALIQFFSNLCFEWLRASVIRHGDEQLLEATGLRRSLKTIYALLVVALLALALILLLASWTVPALFSLVIGLQGLFDGRAAWARANFDNMRLASASILRAVFGTCFVVAAAFATQSAFWAMVGLALSYPAAILVFGDRLSASTRFDRLDWHTALELLRFGGMAAIGSNISMALNASLRSVLVVLFGLSTAGGKIFALELAQRVFSTTGMAFNLLHLQTIIHTVDNQAPENAVAKARGLITLEAAIYLAMIVVINSIALPLADLMAPEAYRSDFAGSLSLFSLLVGLLSWRQFAIDPLFIAFKRVNFVSIAPAVTLGLVLLTRAAIASGLIEIRWLEPMMIGAAAIGLATAFLIIRVWLKGIFAGAAMSAIAISALLAVVLTPDLTSMPLLSAITIQSGIGLTLYLSFLLLALSTQGVMKGEKIDGRFVVSLIDRLIGHGDKRK